MLQVEFVYELKEYFLRQLNELLAIDMSSIRWKVACLIYIFIPGSFS